ncbi:hypothetical protein C2G38_2158353 [Gigaspora rosea]|uniref:Uncharacterized protein n=1 Tax=Gigaspora rosea TaxID=44941 RepID=A0A397W7G7_9GLOM|nr:hypothetical protein C2G38_2158353 [Gigaspora rosea]
MYSAGGDSGGPVYFYSENLNSVSLNGILIASIISTNYSNDITAILPLDIILSQPVLGWTLDMDIGPPMSSPVQSIGPEGVGHWTLYNIKPVHNDVTISQSNYKFCTIILDLL